MDTHATHLYFACMLYLKLTMTIIVTLVVATLSISELSFGDPGDAGKTDHADADRAVEAYCIPPLPWATSTVVTGWFWDHGVRVSFEQLPAPGDLQDLKLRGVVVDSAIAGDSRFIAWGSDASLTRIDDRSGRMYLRISTTDFVFARHIDCAS